MGAKVDSTLVRTIHMLVDAHDGVYVAALLQWVRWQAHWAWDYGVQRRPYDAAAQEYLTRHAMRLTHDAWDAMDEQQRAEAVARKLWVPENQKASTPNPGVPGTLQNHRKRRSCRLTMLAVWGLQTP